MDKAIIYTGCLQGDAPFKIWKHFYERKDVKKQGALENEYFREFKFQNVTFIILVLRL